MYTFLSAIICLTILIFSTSNIVKTRSNVLMNIWGAQKVHTGVIGTPSSRSTQIWSSSTMFKRSITGTGCDERTSTYLSIQALKAHESQICSIESNILNLALVKNLCNDQLNCHDKIVMLKREAAIENLLFANHVQSMEFNAGGLFDDWNCS